MTAAPELCPHRVPTDRYCVRCDPGTYRPRAELAKLTQAQKALAEVETPGDAKVLYDQLETLSQYARRYGVEHEKQNEIAEAKLRTARKGGAILAETVSPGNPQLSRDATIGRSLPDGFTRSMSSRWQALAAIPDRDFEEHLATVKGSDEELTLAGAIRFKKLGVHFSSDTGEWSTPQDLYDELNDEFGFTLDVCATTDNAKTADFFTADDDGLIQDWQGICWMNPPYGEVIGKWVAKAWESAKAGAIVVCLVPARVDTGWWWDYCRHGQIRFLKGRLKFGDGTNSAPFPSAVVVFPSKPAVVWWERAS